MSCSHLHNGRCKLGLFGGRPSAGTCARCDQYAGEARGLGDVVQAVAAATGIKAGVEALAKATGRECGCARRRDKLNQLVPFRRVDDGVHADQDRTQ
jgi:hypothetical protein